MAAIYGPVVINLDKRTDRLEETQKELKRLKFDLIRFPATESSGSLPPSVACLDSHCRVLEEFIKSEFDIAFICEDDVVFNSPRADIDHYLVEFLGSPADVLCFGFYAGNIMEYTALFNVSNDIQNRVSYVVKRKAAKELIHIWRKLYTLLVTKEHIKNPDNWYSNAYNNLPIHNKAADIYRGDQAWKICQQNLQFVLPKKQMAFQRQSYSDIEKAVVFYGN
jgi:GR25 family glycosyltransferase involved in LPS biosynthesis